MSEANLARLCIVGTGFSGTAAFFHLVNALIDNKHRITSVEIITIEERPVNGPGYPYAPYELLPSHLCNNQARMMSLAGNDFYDWLSENRLRLASEFPALIRETHPAVLLSKWEPDPDAFYPRALFGVYLEERFKATVLKARRHGIKVTSLNGYRAVDGYRLSGKFSVVIERSDGSGKEVLSRIDKLLLSTGHWVPEDTDWAMISDTFLNSPYPYAKLRTSLTSWSESVRGKTLTCFVKGMGPSGIDAIMSLAESGQFHYSDSAHVTAYTPASDEASVTIVAGSRCGFFPAVRGESVDYQFQYLTEDSFSELERILGRKLGLTDILSMIDCELRDATSGKIGWQDIIEPKFKSAYEKLRFDVMCPHENNLIHTILLKARRMKFYRHLNEFEKEIYDKELDTHFIRIAVPIPQSNAEKLIALFESGKLESVKMGYQASANPAIHDNHYKLTFIEDDHDVSRQVDTVIRASGQDFRLSLHPSRLVAALAEREELLANMEGHYSTGGIMLDSDESYGVMCRDPETGKIILSPFIASYGVLTRYWQNERNFSAAFVEAAMWLSEEWSVFCTGQSALVVAESASQK
ncbi:FAD/NAD(P)-binding protein [Photobacterium sp. WH77]|uniref:FAD/NAD(P)-binding protein n=1 Tax=unclassified Photobacterium TaxID=2628852 RepID=UPI001EDADC86|nr:MULTISPECIES: FAD/NAD(P)-binding domain-containing protein [unclassified Photobacterium]MCG2838086.1 FAD/NAD(P)-binding protein [Photobacterium sp. WH77]MCG2845704.1 FAD/NAD(P)-binding protein [Photobacterium sp. WH80]